MVKWYSLNRYEFLEKEGTLGSDISVINEHIMLYRVFSDYHETSSNVRGVFVMGMDTVTRPGLFSFSDAGGYSDVLQSTFYSWASQCSESKMESGYNERYCFYHKVYSSTGGVTPSDFQCGSNCTKHVISDPSSTRISKN